MRRGSSTVVSLIAKGTSELLPALGHSLNIATVAQERDGLEGAVAALRVAEGVSSPYVVVGADPLADLASRWHALWEGGGNKDAFEQAAEELLATWKAGRFELPDYYAVVTTEARGGTNLHPNDFYLGFLKSERPGRVVPVLSTDEVREDAGRVLTALSSLPQAPWWPRLDRLVDAGRSFFPGRLAGAPDLPRSAQPTLLR